MTLPPVSSNDFISIIQRLVFAGWAVSLSGEETSGEFVSPVRAFSASADGAAPAWARISAITVAVMSADGLNQRISWLATTTMLARCFSAMGAATAFISLRKR